jgi:predicted DNA binding CopG/RHH family protein
MSSKNKITSKDGKKSITVEEFERLFDEGSDEIDDFLDFSKGEIVKPQQKRVNVDIPQWMLQALDRESNRLGVPRQSLIKMWLAERLENRSA